MHTEAVVVVQCQLSRFAGRYDVHRTTLSDYDLFVVTRGLVLNTDGNGHFGLSENGAEAPWV